MEKILYNLSIKSYSAIIKTSSLFNSKASLWVRGRRQIFKRLAEAFKDNKSKIAWFHCASLGEFEQGRPVIERFKADYPHYKILLTFFSPSGYEMRKNYKVADFVFYLPIDSKSNAERFIEITKPAVVFFIKYESWYYYLWALKQKEIPLILVSAIFRESQLFFKPWGGFYAKLLKNFVHIFVQNKESQELLKQINFSEVSVVGDTRFDRVRQIATTTADVPLIEKFKNKQPLLVAGSTWSKDMEILIPFLNAFPGSLKVIFAPHEIDQEEIDGFMRRLNKKSVKHSNVNFENVQEFDILFIDNIGMLSSLYRYGNYAYIGGGFGKGIHNILEAVVQQIPVFFGPNYQRFKEANDLIELKGAYTVKTIEELTKLFNQLYSNTKELERIKEVTSDYVDQNTGATSKIIDYCKQIIR